MTKIAEISYSCEQVSTCPGCGRVFACGFKGGSARCWCAELPPLPTVPETGRGCYCPDCLRQSLSEERVKLA
ncbi:MAG: hypothetical protein CVU20_07870 [Betaproteobacteria bacterium HGW-Betaproteobacteria-14]|nr:MAG: hypothetical protein CVU20_07870 [Betaproteobacteria bacterium HGW-Betaproteobacteria-14]